MRTRQNILAFGLAVVLCLPIPGVRQSISLAQTEPTRLSHDLGASGTVDAYSISPDHRLVAYCGRDSAGLSGLWIAPLDGSNPVGRVLHIGTAAPQAMVVVAGAPGRERAYVGFASSYRERVTENFDRLTDQRWRQEIARAAAPAWMTPGR